MKVLLLEHPRGRSATHFNDVANAPLSSCMITGYIAALLKENDIETDLLNCYLSGTSLSQMVRTVVEREYDVLGIHLVYSWEHTPAVLEAIEKIKLSKNLPIVVYGFFPTFAGESILRLNQSIDYVIIGEPEITFIKLCEKLKNNNSLNDVEGIVLREGLNISVKKRRPLVEDLDDLPFPVRPREYGDSIGGNILGSRGCYGSCSFCYINNFYGEPCRWRGRTPENICEEIESIKRTLKRSYFYFVDANFFGPGEKGQLRAIRLAELLNYEKDITFGLECRVNDLLDTSLSLLVDAGLKDVFLGIESGSQNCLNRFQKGTTVRKNEEAISMLRHYGIEPWIGFIMFEPASELEDLRNNFHFLKSNNLLHSLSATVDLLYHTQIVFRGADTYAHLCAKGKVMPLYREDYQGAYTFNDERVSFLHEVISSICLHVLSSMDKSCSPLYWRRAYLNENYFPDETVSRVNVCLQETFDELLSRLECDDITCNDRWKDYYREQALLDINHIIRQDGEENKLLQ